MIDESDLNVAAYDAVPMSDDSASDIINNMTNYELTKFILNLLKLYQE